MQNTISMLSREAVAFLRAQFEQRCSPIDGLLPLDLLLEDTGPQSLFHNAPPVSSHAEHPLGKQNIRSLLVHSIHTRKLPLESFLCIWAYCALVDARKAVVAMLYLGYRDTYRRYCSAQVLNACAMHLWNRLSPCENAQSRRRLWAQTTSSGDPENDRIFCSSACLNSMLW